MCVWLVGMPNDELGWLKTNNDKNWKRRHAKINMYVDKIDARQDDFLIHLWLAAVFFIMSSSQCLFTHTKARTMAFDGTFFRLLFIYIFKSGWLYCGRIKYAITKIFQARQRFSAIFPLSFCGNLGNFNRAQN